MGKWIILVGILVHALSAQEPKVRNVVLPSGKPGYSIRCDNLNINVCYELAGDICHRGYEIYSEVKDHGFESGSNAYVGPGFVKGSQIGTANSTTVSTSEKGLLIHCNEPEVTAEERRQRKLAESRARAAHIEAQNEIDRQNSKTVFKVMGATILLLAIFGVVISGL